MDHWLAEYDLRHINALVDAIPSQVIGVVNASLLQARYSEDECRRQCPYRLQYTHEAGGICIRSCRCQSVFRGLCIRGPCIVLHATVLHLRDSHQRPAFRFSDQQAFFAPFSGRGKVFVPCFPFDSQVYFHETTPLSFEHRIVHSRGPAIWSHFDVTMMVDPCSFAIH